jgi:hypothetical protein
VRRLLLALALALALRQPLAAQTLERARIDTHAAAPPAAPAPPAPAPAPGPSHDTDGNWSNGASGLNGEGVVAAALGAVLIATSPFWVPPLALGDDRPSVASFPGHPYALRPDTYLRLDRDGARAPEDQQADAADADFLKPWAARLSLENGNDFRGLNRLGGQLFVDTRSRFGVLSSWSYFSERLTGGGSDETLLGDLNLTFRFAQSEWIQFYTGAGARILTDRHTTRAGFNFLYGADFQPVRPIFVSTLVELGDLDSAFLVHGRATVGANFGRFEVFGGYDFLRIGKVNLQGPLLGLRLWF